MPSKSKVCFFFEVKKFRLQNQVRLRLFIENIFKEEKKQLLSLNFIFCSDNKLLELNQQFLKHDYYTDIITFDLSETDSILAEVYISLDRVRNNAKKLDIPFKTELHRVIFHGVFHLCGYGDKTKREIEKMREKEEFFLSKYIE